MQALLLVVSKEKKNTNFHKRTIELLFVFVRDRRPPSDVVPDKRNLPFSKGGFR